MGLVLHNLKRIEAGLKGERLATDSTLDKSGEAELKAEELGLKELPHLSLNGVAAGTDGWQDKAVFEREQDIEQSAIGDKSSAIDGWGHGGVVPRVGIQGTKGTIDKDDRKRKKKEKRLRERQNSQTQKLTKRNSKG